VIAPSPEPDTLTPRQQVLCDVLTCAVEGGISYWCNEPAENGTLQIERIDRGAADLTVRRIVFNVAAVEDVSGASVRHGFTNGARTTGLTVTLDATALQRALRAIIAGKVTWGGQPLGPNSTMRTLALQLVFAKSPDDVPDYDAGDADNLLQAALFGDVVYG
jgi:hypothetical protein